MKFTDKDVGADVIVRINSTAGPIVEPGQILGVGHTQKGNPYVTVSFLGHMMNLNPDCVTKVETVHRFTQADIGKTVYSEKYCQEGVISAVDNHGRFPVWVTVGTGAHAHAYEEVSRIINHAKQTDDCPECQGTGIIKLFTSTEPCSICKTTKKSSVS